MRTKLGKTVVCLFIGMMLGSVSAMAGRFADNGDDTVTDSATGLVWQQRDDDKTRNWTGALAYCEGLDLAGHTDWRLPNIRELRSIVDHEKYNPAIDSTLFPGTNSSYYWSSTSFASDADDAWYVDFHDGLASSYYGSYGHYVRCVRGGE